MFDFAGFDREAKDCHRDHDCGEGDEQTFIVEWEVDVLGGEGDGENSYEMTDEGAFDESDFVGVRLIIDAIWHCVRDRKWVIGKFQLWIKFT